MVNVYMFYVLQPTFGIGPNFEYVVSSSLDHFVDSVMNTCYKEMYSFVLKFQTLFSLCFQNVGHSHNAS